MSIKENRMGYKVFCKVDRPELLPSKGSNLAAGYDLKYSGDEDFVIKPWTRAKIPTGVRLAIPKDMYGHAAARSGLAINKGTILMAGIVDADYRGELFIIILNASDEDIVIKPLDRIAQIIFHHIRLTETQLLSADELSETERGDMGFGSTGS
jgi:dUTP pyrophosphatase